MRRYGAWSRQAGTVRAARSLLCLLKWFHGGTPPWVLRVFARARRSRLVVRLCLLRETVAGLVRLARRLLKPKTPAKRGPYDELV